MTDIDTAYYTRRAAEEGERAASCADPAIALVHRQLANQYERLVSAPPSTASSAITDAPRT